MRLRIQPRAGLDRRRLVTLLVAGPASAPATATAVNREAGEADWFASRRNAANGRTPPGATRIIIARHDPDGSLCNAEYREVFTEGPLNPWEILTDHAARRWALAADQAIKPQMFGARGDGKTNDTRAFNAAAEFIQRNNGGLIVVPPGVYLWGEQEFAGRSGRGFAFRGRDLIAVRGCAQPLVIEFQGCRIVTQSGLRFGSFDPVSGLPHMPAPPFYDGDATAHIGSVLDLRDNVSVAIVGTAEFDGNIESLAIGGIWGDTGRQLPHSGVVAYNNRAFSCENILAHHFGLDGFIIGWTGLTERDPIYPHTLGNCRGLYNGRQGLSWVGGNNLRIEGGEFSHTGKNGVVVSAPAAGIDIEAEESICRNGHFVAVRCFDNTGVGLLADQGDAAKLTLLDCTFIGTTAWSVWALKTQFNFISCTVIGAVAWIKGDSEPARAAKVIGGHWSMDANDSPNGVIYGDKMDFGAAENVLFQGVDFTAGGKCALPWSNLKTRYDNCTFAQEGNATFYTRGVFTGLCSFTAPDGSFDHNGSTFIGRVTLNGKEL